MPDKNRRETHNTNENIKADPVRVIGAEGEQLGVLPIKAALSHAREANLDLVEVSPKANPPVCKILDYGKFKFQEQKRASEAKKRAHTIVVKEISIRPRTDEHDYQVKMKKVREFLDKGYKVKMNMRFRGREVTHQDQGKDMFDRIVYDMMDVGRAEQRSGLEGRFMTMLLVPDTSQAKKKADLEAAKAEAAAAEA